jgi:hypothetical protein
MADLGPAYIRQIWDDKRINAIYPPGEALYLGDVYEYERGVYRFRSTLGSRGIPVKSRRSQGNLTWTSKSKNSSKIVTKVAGKLPKGVVTSALGKADAGAIVQFTDSNAYVVSLSKVSVKQVTNLDAIAEHLAKLWWSNRWDTKYLIVSEVWQADSATILTSSSDSSQVELKAKANVQTARVSIADLSTKFTLADEGASSDHFVATELTPLFRAHKLGPSGHLEAAGRRSSAFDFLVESETDADMSVELAEIGAQA